ncbi:MAG: hypothetical protein AB7U30_12870 [Sulfuricellaceae bacterium]|jgi:energy-coupling factor transporter transmembrane protein EcfT
MNLHPATRISAWLVFALFVGWLAIPALAVVSLALAALLVNLRQAPLFRLFRRTRWLLLSLLLVYSLTYPGRLLLPQLGAWSPTLEGLQAGALQAWRMALLLTGLAALHGACDRECLIAGLFRLMWPLHRLGVNVRRVAGRMWLTLEYAESSEKWTREEWHRLLAGELDDLDGNASRRVSVSVGAMRGRDAAALLVLLAMLGGLAQW